MLKLTGQLRLHRDNWACVHVDEELGRYYRTGFNWHNRFNGLRVGDTKWGPHVSFVRQEDFPNKDQWQPLHEVDIEFNVELIYRTNGKHLWFNVLCDRLLDIRESLGLSRFIVDHPPFYGLHLTLGTYHKISPSDVTQLVMPPSLFVDDGWVPLPHDIDCED